jgi:hypothetical protein
MMSASQNKKMDNNRSVWVMGLPRSGTSWLGQIFDSHPDVRFKLSPLFSYAFKDALNNDSTREEIEQFLQEVYHREDSFLDQVDRRLQGDYPTFETKNIEPACLVIKENRYHNLIKHLLATCDKLQVVYIVRNPCGAIHSWLSCRNEFPEGAKPMEQWRSGAIRKKGKQEEFWGFDDWKLLTAMYQDMSRLEPDRVKVISYEQLVSNVVNTVTDMFSFAGLGMNSQTLSFLRESQLSTNKDSYAVYKEPGVAQRWQNELDPQIISVIIKDLAGSELEHYLHY